MSSPPSAPPTWRTRLARPWSQGWRLALALLGGLVAFAVVWGTTIDALGADADGSVRVALLMALDVLAAPVAIGLLVVRRRPAAAAAVVLLSTFSTLAAGAGVLAAVSFAAAQTGRRIAVLGVVFVALSTGWARLIPADPDFPLWGEAVGLAVVYALLVLVGRYVRSRRQLVATLEEQARSARREQEALAENARSAERARIAREMHDALGHRLSLIAMHAGALESRPDLSAADTRLAAGVVRESAHHAMGELRQVLGVLNEASPGRAEGTDVPTLAQLDELVAAGVGGGAVPDLRCETDVATVPETVSRHLYRVAQEALTNVRKHAPGRATSLVVRDAGPDAVELVVRSRMPEHLSAGSADRSRHGLAGLAERCRLAGGSLTAGPDGTDFVVRAVLPCRR